MAEVPAQAGSANAPAVEIARLCREFESFRALDNVSLSVRRGEFFSLLGPSGCGKTTLLRIIAGLDLADSGTLRIGGQDATEVPAHLRPVNTVFQSYALFPHLSVRDNVAFGLRMKKRPMAEIAERVARALALVRIEALAGRKPEQLSGGQKQRVALARALINEPQVLLLDEPLAALDLKLRKELQVELLSLQRLLGITFIFVTHDQEEALVMSDRIAVMRAGRIEQMGEAEAMYEQPRTRFVAQFLGSCNLLDARRLGGGGGDIQVETACGKLRAVAGPRLVAATGRDNFTLAIRPEKIALRAPAVAGENEVAVVVEQLIYSGAETHYQLAAGDQKLTAYAMNARVGSQGFEIGQAALAHLPPDGLIALED